MSGYRDSYFQYHHLADSHQVLYSEWNQDEFPPPDEQEVDNHANKSATSGGNNGGSTSNEYGDNANSKSFGNTNNRINVYWDYFHDEEDWNLFRNVQLESNGIATFTQPIDISARNETDESTEAAQGDNMAGNKESASALTGSIFNHSVTKMAIMRNNNWNDIEIPHP
ncbi:hypothetical protein HG535_0H02430 [Zygotorulaspora mrakii]|uniref:Uncharacterized protein n=1 Tax=Zygotorulaspora mrakii TaxID=42260 RepID=A0A7H9B963_ZYGMR|nr:uncharacterized protein HG535_0H02430 [Zygotorulaspora mrakii]QLG74916.1 hypothetical protein HG535_0H02430 [Zygotorulaspora mrakii]